MTGAVLDLVAKSKIKNDIITGNPKTTCFKSTYKKCTPFSMQKFRIDFEGLRHLQENTPTTLEFEINRYGDLINDIYLVVKLPDIYSGYYDNSENKQAYEFKWIKEIGVQMIQKISIHADGLTIQEYDGEYLSMMKERDYSYEKKQKWNKMVGNVPELNDPEAYFFDFFKNDKYGKQYDLNDVSSCYPTIPPSSNTSDDYIPSIKSKTLYIPLETLFCPTSKHSLPLIALQYQKITIKITFRPIRELYVIKDNSGVYIQPGKNKDIHKMYYFLQPPPSQGDPYNNSIMWKGLGCDIHLFGNYIFLDNAERNYFSKNTHSFLYKDVIIRKEFSICGSNSIDLKHCGLTSSFLWRFRRDDADKRNEWSNYTNWEYEDKFPYDLSFSSTNGGLHLRLPIHLNGLLYKNILESLAIKYNGAYREVDLHAGIYNHMEQFRKSKGNGKDGLYSYNYCMGTDKGEYQPKGATNLMPFKNIFFEFTTIVPPLKSINGDTNNGDLIVCDGMGAPAFINKAKSDIYLYTYDMKIYEERYNMITIKDGMLTTLHAR